MIDLRSDTVTTPTEGMRKAMANAVVGDDVFSEDPTVNELQEYVAELFGKESALFVPSGCMGNQISLAVHAKTGDEVIVEGESHIFHYETTAPSIIARVQVRCVNSASGEMNPSDVEAAIRPGAYYFPRTSVVCVENTHNRHGGTVVSLENIKALREVCTKHSLAFHCDGARIWNASAKTGIALNEYAQYFDTLSVCLSKALGAPVGSLIVGKKEHTEVARRWRKILGGGMRQAGVLAAAGLYAIKEHFPLLPQDHENAEAFATTLYESEIVQVDNYPVQTNIVVFKPNAPNVDITEFIAGCQTEGLRISPGREGGWLRAVFHHQVSKQDGLKAAEVIITQAKKYRLS